MAATILTGLLLVLVSAVYGDDGGVTRELNVTREWDTSCMTQLKDNATCQLHPLAHVVASSPQDTLHILVSLWAAPSCLVLRTPLDSQVDVDWALLLNGSQPGGVRADRVLAAYGFSIDQLIEFDDPDDTADLTGAPGAAVQPFSMDLTPAGRTLDVTKSPGQVAVSVTAPPRNTSRWSATGTLTVKVVVLNDGRRTDELPHLQQTGDSLVAGLVLNKLKTNSRFNHTRFGVRMTAFSNQTQTLQQTKSLDDEYTPGVFKLMSLSSPAADSGYLQWRPVAYTASEYTIEHSTTARHYRLESTPSARPVSPLLWAYFGQRATSHGLNVTFGLSEDGWYKETQYAAWELTVGLGAPPTDQFSLMVILLLGIGLGLPTVALIAGGVWMVVRRVRGQSGGAASLLTEEQ